MKKKVIILGAGLTGLSSAYYLKKDYLIFEKEKNPGGLCRSVYIGEGFTFDYTGHLLHLHQAYTKNLVCKLLKGNLKKIKRNSAIYFQGRYIPYPFQANLWALPEKIRNECLKGLHQSPPPSLKSPTLQSFGDGALRPISNSITQSPVSFHDWCLLNYGKGISKYFFFPYNEKIWLRSLKEINTDWVSPFIPQIAKKEIIEGAEKKLGKDFGYNTYFYYPKKGGIQILIDAFAKKIRNIQLNSKVEKVDWKKKIVSVTNKKFEYQYFISTIPLPELIDLLERPPIEVKEAKKQLSWTSVLCINLGIQKTENKKQKTKNEKLHWIYFPEKEFIFYRIGFYHNFSKEMVPKRNKHSNYISLYIEIAHQPDEILNQQKVISRVKRDLLRCRILNEKDKILITNLLPISYAYVIYDHNRNLALSKINNFLQKNGILSLGRYGTWKYSFMEESILDGKNTAEILNQIQMTKSK